MCMECLIRVFQEASDSQPQKSKTKSRTLFASFYHIVTQTITAVGHHYEQALGQSEGKRALSYIIYIHTYIHLSLLFYFMYNMDNELQSLKAITLWTHAVPSGLQKPFPLESQSRKTTHGQLCIIIPGAHIHRSDRYLYTHNAMVGM